MSHEIASPAQVPIMLPKSGNRIEGIANSASDIPCTTMLFRAENRLPGVVDHCLKVFDVDRQLSVLSIGCSVGAEVDSLSALFKSRGFRRVSLLGLDVEPKLIDLATEGNYTTGLIQGEDYRGRVARTITDHKFKIVDKTNAAADTGVDPPVDVYELSASPVREGYEVDFAVSDFSSDRSIEVRPDLVVMNYLIFQLLDGNRRPMMERIRSVLQPCGVLAMDGFLYRTQEFERDEVPDSDGEYLLEHSRGQDLFELVRSLHA